MTKTLITLLFVLSSNTAFSSEKVDYDKILKENFSLEKTTSPFNCSNHRNSEKWFEFVVINKKSETKTFNRDNACNTINEYAESLYGGFAKFWPLKKNLGIELAVEDHASSYNAAFVSDLGSPYIKPRLLLIYIENTPLTPQRKVWAHEYGHGVLDEYVRSVLNKKYGFDELIRASENSFSKYTQGTIDKLRAINEKEQPLRTKINSLYDERRALDEKSAKIQDQFSPLQFEKHDLDVREVNVRNLETEILNLNNEFYGSWQRIEMMYGNLDKFPEGKKFVEAYEKKRDSKSNDFFSGLGFKPMHEPDQKKVNEHLAKIESLKNERVSIQRQIAKEKAALAPAYTRVQTKRRALESILNKLNRKKQNIDLEIENINASIAELSVEEALIRQEQLKINGIKNLPGISIMSYYHEFFADLFTAVYLNDPNAIGDALEALVPGKEQASADARRFQPLNPNLFTLDVWNPEANLGPHLFFTPTRAAIGPDLIIEANKQKKGKLLIRKTLDMIAKSIADYAINVNTELLLPYSPIIKNVSSVKTAKELSEYLIDLEKTNSLSSGFISMQMLADWCKKDFTACKSLVLSELKKGHDGLFMTSIKSKEANINLYNGLLRISEEILR